MKNKLLEIIKKEIIKETKKIINNAKVTARENKLDNIDKLLLINNNIELYLDSLKEYFIFDDDLINKIFVLKNESIIEAKKDICNVILNIIKNEQKDVFIKIIDYINTLKSKGIDIDINSIENSIYKPINLDMQFLEYNQVFGINKLDIIKKYGTKCELTDFAILLGSIVSEDNKTGWWWIKNYAGYGDAKVVCYEGNCYSFPVNIDSICIRPVIKYSSIEKYCTNKKVIDDNILEVDFGELPNNTVNIQIYNILENKYNDGSIERTSKVYTIDNEYNKFKNNKCIEYIYDNKKYIRFVVFNNKNKNGMINGEKINVGDIYWLEVKNIRWIVSLNNDIAIPKYLIFSGIKFNNDRNYSGDFNNTNIKNFMDNHLSIDIQQLNSIKNKYIKSKKLVKNT